MPSFADLQGYSSGGGLQAQEDPNNPTYQTAVMPKYAIPPLPGTVNAQGAPSTSTVSTPGSPSFGGILDNALNPSNILGTVTPLATGLVGLLGNQQSTDALKSGAADATKTITEGNAQIQELLKSIYGDQSKILQPYQALGQQGVDALSAGIKPGGDLVSGYQGPTEFTRDPNFTRNTDFTDPTKFSFNADDLAKDPGMQFRIAEQNKLLARRQASSGSLSSGAALKAATDYAGHLADQEYGTAYDRAQGTFTGNYNRAADQFTGNYGRANAQFADNYNRDATTFGNNFNRGLAEQQSNQQQRMDALKTAAGIGQNASNTLVGAKGDQGRIAATTQQLTNSQIADLQTSLASAIAAGDTARANQISGIISGTLGAVTSANDAAAARANKPAPNTTTINNAGGAGGAGGVAQGGQGGTVGNVSGGNVGDVTADTGPITNTQGSQTNTQGDQTNTQGDQTNTQTEDPGGSGQPHAYSTPDENGNVTDLTTGEVLTKEQLDARNAQQTHSKLGQVLGDVKTGTDAAQGVSKLAQILGAGKDATGAVQTAGDVTHTTAGAIKAAEKAAEAAGVIGGAAGAAGAGAGAAAGTGVTLDSAIGSSIAGGGTGTMASLGAFLTNPITIGVGAALAGALIWKKSQAHPTADKFIKDSQGPFGEHLGKVVDGFDQSLATGQLDKQTAQGLYDQTKSFIDGFEADRAGLEAKGGKSAEVARNAKKTMTTNFGPNYEKILGKMQNEIAGLPDAGNGQVSAAVQPRSTSQQMAQMAGVA